MQIKKYDILLVYQGGIKMIEENKNANNGSNKKKIFITIVFVILIIVIGLCLSINMNSNKHISNSNSNEKSDNLNNSSEEKSDSEDSDEINEQNVQQDEYIDEDYVCPEGLELLVDFIGYRGVFGPDNMLDNEDIRIQYIQFLLMNENKVTWTSGDYQSFPYIKEEDFKNKYNETFDTTAYNYDNDKDNINFFDCNDYDETKNKNYKCWNGTQGVYGNKIYLYAKDIKDDVIKGEYKRSSNESGAFEIKYTINNNKKYLKSIIMTSN